jgi:hypothetical protein
MLSFRASIVVTMAATFAVSLGVMSWHRDSAGALMPNLATPPSVVRQRAAAPVMAPASPTQSVAPALPAMVQERKPPSSAHGSSVTSSTELAQIPVEVAFRRRARLNKFEGRIANTSGDPLVIDVRVLSASTHYTTQAQVSVGAYLATGFGIDDGLDMQSGDQVTLQTNSFRDQVIQIP